MVVILVSLVTKLKRLSYIIFIKLQDHPKENVSGTYQL